MQQQRRRNKKIFLPFVPRDISGLLPLLEGGDIFFTEREEGSGALEGAPGGAFSCAGKCVAAAFTLEAIAPAVVACAEALGGIDRLVFAPGLSAHGRLLLDLSYDELTEHTAAINALFALCGCALPYMLGRGDAEIIIALPHEEENCISRIYRAAARAAAESLGEELAGCGVNVRLIGAGL